MLERRLVSDQPLADGDALANQPIDVCQEEVSWHGIPHVFHDASLALSGIPRSPDTVKNTGNTSRPSRTSD
jgi:hypothetical protein